MEKPIKETEELSAQSSREKALVIAARPFAYRTQMTTVDIEKLQAALKAYEGMYE